MVDRHHYVCSNAGICQAYKAWADKIGIGTDNFTAGVIMRVEEGSYYCQALNFIPSFRLNCDKIVVLNRLEDAVNMAKDAVDIARGSKEARK